jgi:maltose-binding protein MalE
MLACQTRSLYSITLCLALFLVGCNAGNSTGLGVATATHQLAPTHTPTLEPTPTTIVPSGTISIWHSWQDDQVSALLRIISAFQDEYPEVIFDVLYVPEIDLKAGFAQAMLEKRGPSILIAPGEWGPEFYQADAIIDVTNYLNPELEAGLNTAALQAGKFRQVQIGLPVQMQGVVLFRNARLIPRSPATFEELVSLASTAARSDRFGAVLERSFFFSGAHLLGLGGSLMDSTGMPAFNDASGSSWIKLLRDFELAGPIEFLGDNDLNTFKESRAGFIIDGTWNRRTLIEAVGSESVMIDPWPIHGSGQLSGFVLAENLYLTPQTLVEPHQVSRIFTQFFLRSESLAILAEYGMIPAMNDSTATVIAAKIQANDPLTSQAMRALMDGAAYPVHPEIEIYEQQLDIALQSIFADQASPAAGLRSAEEAIRQALELIRKAPTASP